MNILLNNKVAIDGESATGAAPGLCDRLDEVSVGSDVYAFLSLIGEIATATDAQRAAVSAWCGQELASLDGDVQAADGS